MENDELSAYGGVVERFLRYVRIDTQSCEDSDSVPSTAKQLDLARLLRDELKAMGAADVALDESTGIVTATLPATARANDGGELPTLGFIAHMDTSPAVSGCGVRPRIHEDYQGGFLVLDEEKGLRMGPRDFPELKDYVGCDLITSSGDTLLGADDKAGVAEIMGFAQMLLEQPNIAHPRIRIAFTPDEEIGRGTDHFDVGAFGAAYAYTVDGGAWPGIEYECFNAASATVCFTGLATHPGSALGRMRNALVMATDFCAKLPAAERPENTSGYKGFYMLEKLEGDVSSAKLQLIIRDHDRHRFERRKTNLWEIADAMNDEYGAQVVKCTITDSYYNMRDALKGHEHLVETAKRVMRLMGSDAVVEPIRGGTDGARLSFAGLPCPNLCTGGHNFHSVNEFIPIESMCEVVLLLLGIAASYGERR
ncbi:MAG: peptidase T [Coriobacteriales bacterium]|nr:peptidase T [Coriobacteriales bacterium]